MKTPSQPDPPQTIGKTLLAGSAYAMPKFSAILPKPETTGDFEEMCLAAGESAALTAAITTAQEVVRTMGREAERALERQRPSAAQLRHRSAEFPDHGLIVAILEMLH